MAALPLLSGLPDLPPLLEPKVMSSTFGSTASGISPVAAFGIFMSQKDHNEGERPCPDIGGQHITEEWLWSMKPRECMWRFRLSASEIMEMVDALEIPETFITASRSSFTGVEALCLLTARFRTAGDMYLLSMQYN
ncbi:hypothetical protein JAAARDRAFT_190869 [Jaapia argillacea MUCL 33604]|uniref:Uncharacterized protein n=1 Tax=Jaapia argillacea MUCL 33604 TaxID=933084 RepID=A0A067PIC0_9AGAM|nr:hypothetical protein JAAARDRAFT_197384 [Jaapia argillacea MUCL 33604]KDQ60715.1 hypothetical protein JAAARDRAFT_190869 [Jaapia argillacea MUCL 33604]